MITLPIPPSTNNLFFNRYRGRTKTDAYKAWITQAGCELNLQRVQPVPGYVEVEIRLPQKMRGDIDNRAKAILDLFVSHKLIEDDAKVARLVIERDQVAASLCFVGLKARAA